MICAKNIKFGGLIHRQRRILVVVAVQALAKENEVMQQIVAAFVLAAFYFGAEQMRQRVGNSLQIAATQSRGNNQPTANKWQHSCQPPYIQPECAWQQIARNCYWPVIAREKHHDWIFQQIGDITLFI